MQNEHRLSLLIHHQPALARLQRDRSCTGIDEDPGGRALPIERSACLVELARQIRCPDPDPERDDGRDRRGRGEHRYGAAPSGLERNDHLWRFGPHFRQDALAQLGARLGARCGDGERLGGLPERGELVLAVRAGREMRLVLATLLGVERVQRVARGQLVNSGFHDLSSAESSSSSRRRASPANILLLIVPSGTPSLSASSDWENPP